MRRETHQRHWEQHYLQRQRQRRRHRHYGSAASGAGDCSAALVETGKALVELVLHRCRRAKLKLPLTTTPVSPLTGPENARLPVDTG